MNVNKFITLHKYYVLYKILKSFNKFNVHQVHLTHLMFILRQIIRLRLVELASSLTFQGVLFSQIEW